MTTYSATYSPDDNKLRLYASSRLDAETYARVKAAGFRWAPKQDLFVAPAWSPGREDLLIELAGEVGDEDTSLSERAEQRAERFDDYRESRTADAESAQKAVHAIADGIPFGQPILVGHHSEKHARKDAERIENGMRRAVKMWETAEYWKGRAAGAIRHAKYKERPDVRARRIKGLEKDQRKQKQYHNQHVALLEFWTGFNPDAVPREPNFVTPLDLAKHVANVSDHGGIILPDGERYWSLWGALNDGKVTVQEVKRQRLEGLPRAIAYVERWLAHIEHRLDYERAMLADSGGTVADRTGPEKGGAVKCWAAPRGGWAYIQKVNKVSVTILDNWGNGRGGNFTRTIPFDKLAGVMTAAQVADARARDVLRETDDGTGFFLFEDGDAAPRIEYRLKEQPPATTAGTPPVEDHVCPDGATCPDPECQAERTKQGIEVMRATLKAGITVKVVPDLFPTPTALARRMIDLADIEPDDRVLEPSAGTGNLVDAILRRAAASQGVKLLAVEVNRDLADGLARFQTPVTCADFLACRADLPPAGQSHELGTKVLGQFDRIVMNPPFGKGQDIRHIKHALTMLKPGGRLVALCADGPRQQEQLQPLADSWESLEDAFIDVGTGVRVALLTFTKEAA